MISITFSIPVYNDENTLKTLIEECIQISNLYSLNFKILIINDASTDSSGVIANNLALQHNYISVVHHKTNLSFGPTIKEVFTLPQTEWICFVPGDHQFNSKEFVSNCKDLLDKFDLFIGKRINRNDNFRRKIISSTYNFLIRNLFHYNISDVNSVVLFRKKIIETIHINGNSAFVHAELFINAKDKGFRVKEIPINHKKREYGKAGGSKINVIFTTFIDMLLFYIIRVFKP